MALQTLTDDDYEHISRIIYQHSRIYLGDGKRELVSSRLGKRLRATGCETYSEYCALLGRIEGEVEINQLVDAISTNHTFFFRENKHFSFLEDTVLREFHNNPAYRGDGCFRCWSAAASTGEEPYSIAITLARHEDVRLGFRWEMDCSDISSTALDKARQGIYSNERISDLPIEVRRRFFQKGIGKQEGRSRVKLFLRDRNLHFEVISAFELILETVCGDLPDGAVYDGYSVAAERCYPDLDFLFGRNVVRVLRTNAGFKDKFWIIGYDVHDPFAGGDDAANCVCGEAHDHAIDRRS
jgi:chemotaxis protein methyltransferase CheR